ncbi:endonuclease domain-containing protein [Leifsonia sp. AG29]|uniref:endonuclease domain-containing protein n=1 Tax=Leifsonia sp. AG29 TaxID=2598860 RepID=UPI00131CD957|nr:hypothetical protein [Leifsonia sp. AG29]
MKPSAPLPSLLQHAAIRRADARALGVSPKRLRGPDVHRPFRGVVTALPELTLVDLCRAFLAVRPPGAFFSGATAAALHGVPLPRRACWEHSRRLDVSVPAPARAPRRHGITGHSVRISLGDVTVKAGLPVSTPERTWCELGGALTVDELVVAGDWLIAEERRLCDTTRLRAALHRSPARRGRPALTEAIGLVSARSESPQESLLRARLERSGVHGGRPNEPIRVSSGARYRGDLVYVEERLILEYQGDHHRDRGQYRRDLSRRLDLQADGWRVVELGPEDLHDPGLSRRVRALLRQHRAPLGSVRAASAPEPTR